MQEETAFAYNKTGMDYEAPGNKEEALKHYKEALSIYEITGGFRTEIENIRQSIGRIGL